MLTRRVKLAMGWVYGTATWFQTGNPPESPATFCGIGYDPAYDHAWAMITNGGDSRNYNDGCCAAMHNLACGQTGTTLYSADSLIMLQYVRTIDAGPCLTHASCSPNLCGSFDPDLLVDLTPGAFTGLGFSLYIGHIPVWVYQS